jgi:hypothetical protein
MQQNRPEKIPAAPEDPRQGTSSVDPSTSNRPPPPRPLPPPRSVLVVGILLQMHASRIVPLIAHWSRDKHHREHLASVLLGAFLFLVSSSVSVFVRGWLLVRSLQHEFGTSGFY